MRVLLAVDGSDGSFEAIDQVAPLLRSDRDEVALYSHPPQVQVRIKNVARDVLEGAEESFANLIFAKARKRLGNQFEEKAHTILGHQDARRGVVVAAQQWSADLIVVGARGLNAFERLLLGSVSRAVVHASTIPVWVARPRGSGSGRGWKVLLASESPATARRPATLLEQFAWPQNTEFTVMTVLASIFAGRVPDWLQQQARSPDVESIVQRWASEHDAEMRDNVAKVKELVESLRPPLSTARPLVTEGEPTASILATAARDKHDLIVVGSHQNRSTGGVILGSVSEAVLNSAGCSVLLVPHLEAP
jgi:nucleotide-binding universal stress UspA family protein